MMINVMSLVEPDARLEMSKDSVVQFAKLL